MMMSFVYRLRLIQKDCVGFWPTTIRYIHVCTCTCIHCLWFPVSCTNILISCPVPLSPSLNSWILPNYCTGRKSLKHKRSSLLLHELLLACIYVYIVHVYTYIHCLCVSYIYIHVYMINQTSRRLNKAKQIKSTRLRKSFFFQRKLAASGGIRTHDTLLSRLSALPT